MTRSTAAAVLLASLASGCADLPPKTQEQLAGRRIEFVCFDGKQFTAEFAPDASYVRLTLPDRQALLRLRGATDAFLRYSDGQIGFGTNGREAALADQVFVREGDCFAR